ncbi:MAG: gas vesicle protein GvpA [Nitrospirae bacterium RBG_19FT_COMBO_58_9]|nr:MAG: gas vesicle protein GvpA [Nitrospirae bacterium RBG_19FT_COMBO_58_9]
MGVTQRSTVHSVESATLADVLERILDKGLVIAGDIKIKLVDIELLTIQIRLVVCSVDKAREMGIDWWMTNSYLCSSATKKEQIHEGDAPRQEVAPLKENPINEQAAI